MTTAKKNDEIEAEQVNDTISKAEEAIIDTSQEIKDTLIALQDTVVDYIKNHPLKAMSFTLLAGVIAAQIMRPRK